jgi:hypothetical protein
MRLGTTIRDRPRPTTTNSPSLLKTSVTFTPKPGSPALPYKLGKTVLYSRGELVDKGSGLLGLASRLAFKAMNISVSVDDLTEGKRIECKDIVEMLAVQDQLKEAAATFKAVLEAAAFFGGEEVVEI